MRLNFCNRKFSQVFIANTNIAPTTNASGFFRLTGN